jgi:ATP-dependent DNA helicase DinG
MGSRRACGGPTAGGAATAYPALVPSLDDLLHAAVGGVGGIERPGQVEMAHAVADAIDGKGHLLVQAGTGTGKSLAYLVPAVRHAMDTGTPTVVATATLALQAQIVDRDMPRLAESLAPLLGRRPTYALVKGRRNYLCAHKLEGGFPDDDADTLMSVGAVDQQASRLGAEVVRLRDWAEVTESGDRDELVPGVSERAWRQVSVSAHECLGGRCPMVSECFVERSREAARDVDVIVTNHSFMAIDAFEGRQMLPEHDVLVVDEGHELVDRVTSTITDEVTPGMIRAAAKRAGRQSDSSSTMEEAADLLESVLEPAPEGRLTGIPDSLGLALSRVRDTARAVQSELNPQPGEEPDGGRQVARAAVDEVFENASRILEERELDVVWLNRDPRRGPVLRVAPMSVAMLVRDKFFSDRTVVLTSATLELGGSFDAVAGTIGLRGEGAPEWRGLDVGSPFAYPEQGIAYVARHLPPPGRDGLATQTLDEIEALVRAAGGRTLGLFSSMRAAKEATEAMRERFADLEGDIAFLCQGEDQISTLVRQFARDPRTCLFGTLSLWQGVDVPGSSCQLVIIDRIPFPRPDDPLASARSQAIARMGGNGFMAVSATHAALRLAQGAGRLIRRSDDRGVVAFLDNRMMTAGYAGFLQRSLPPFWPTADRAMVLAALKRLDETAEPPQPVAEPALRGLTGAVSMQIERPVAEDPPPPESSRTAVTHGHAWTEQEDEELRDGIELGLTLDELARTSPLSATRGRVTAMSDEVAVRHRVPPFVLVAGPESLLAERAVTQTLDDLKVTEPELETIRLYAAAYTAGELTLHASPSLFGGAKCIVVHDVDEADDELQADLLAALSGEPEPDLTLVVLHKGGPRGKKVLDTLKGSGARVIDAPAIKTDRDKADFAAHEFRAARRKATGEAVHALVEAVGKDVRELSAACQQLIDDTTGVIDEQVVLTYHGGKVEATGFRVADAAMTGDTGEALRLLRHAIAVGVDPVPIVAVLAQQARQLIKVGSAGRGRSADLARDLGMAPWQVDKARRALGGWTADALATCVTAIAAADFEVKGGGRDPVYAVERCVLTITGQHARNRA